MDTATRYCAPPRAIIIIIINNIILIMINNINKNDNNNNKNKNRCVGPATRYRARPLASQQAPPGTRAMMSIAAWSVTQTLKHNQHDYQHHYRYYNYNSHCYL